MQQIGGVSGASGSGAYRSDDVMQLQAKIANVEKQIGHFTTPADDLNRAREEMEKLNEEMSQFHIDILPEGEGDTITIPTGRDFRLLEHDVNDLVETLKKHSPSHGKSLEQVWANVDKDGVKELLGRHKPHQSPIGHKDQDKPHHVIVGFERESQEKIQSELTPLAHELQNIKKSLF